MYEETGISGSDLLGEVITWDVRTPQIGYTLIKQALTDAGLNPDDAHELSPRNAFGRACKDLKQGRAIDKLEFDHGIAKFQFTKKTALDEKIDYDYECQVTLDVDSGAVSCPEKPGLEKMATDLLAHAIATRNASDITRLVQRMFENHADLFPINPRKGVAYFVPESHRGFTDRVGVFLKSVGGSVSRFPVPKGTEHGNASVRDAVESGLTTLLDELNESVTTWGEGTKDSTMDRAYERLEAIKYKVDAYAEYLESAQGALVDGLAEAKKKIIEKMDELGKTDEDEVSDDNLSSSVSNEALAT